MGLLFIDGEVVANATSPELKGRVAKLLATADTDLGQTLSALGLVPPQYIAVGVGRLPSGSDQSLATTMVHEIARLKYSSRELMGSRGGLRAIFNKRFATGEWTEVMAFDDAAVERTVTTADTLTDGTWQVHGSYTLALDPAQAAEGDACASATSSAAVSTAHDVITFTHSSSVVRTDTTHLQLYLRLSTTTGVGDVTVIAYDSTLSAGWRWTVPIAQVRAGAWQHWQFAWSDATLIGSPGNDVKRVVVRLAQAPSGLTLFLDRVRLYGPGTGQALARVELSPAVIKSPNQIRNVVWVWELEPQSTVQTMLWRPADGMRAVVKGAYRDFTGSLSRQDVSGHPWQDVTQMLAMSATGSREALDPTLGSVLLWLRLPSSAPGSAVGLFSWQDGTSLIRLRYLPDPAYEAVYQSGSVSARAYRAFSYQAGAYHMVAVGWNLGLLSLSLNAQTPATDSIASSIASMSTDPTLGSSAIPYGPVLAFSRPLSGQELSSLYSRTATPPYGVI